MQDLCLWGEDDHEKGGRSAQNDTGGARYQTEGSRDHGHQEHH